MEDRRRPKGPVPLLNRDQIAGAAVGLADRHGLAAVTMRRLAADLGTAGPSLYRYFTSRDELLDAMVDRVLRDLAVEPATGTWQHDVVALGSALLAVHRHHRWLVDVRQGQASPGPSTVDLFERGLVALAPLPADDARRMEAIAMLIGVTTLFAQQEAHASAVAFPALDAERWPRLAGVLQSPQAPLAAADVVPAKGLFERAVVGVVAGVLGAAAEP
jgi:AcrR family transcriptional regulator